MTTPVFNRCFLYTVLAGLGPPTAFFTAAAKDIIDGKQPVFHWVIWVLLALQTAGAALLAIRIYIDDSNARYKKAKAKEKDAVDIP